MSWFDEQIQERKRLDQANFTEALEGIAGAVMGKRLSDALNDRQIAQTAIEEILRCYHCKPRETELPSSIQSFEEQINFFLQPYGILHRSVKLAKGWYKDAVGAMLGTMKEDGRAVALIPGKFSGYFYLDLKSGKRVKVSRKNEGLLDSEAYCFYQPLPLKQLNMVDLLRFMYEQYNLSDTLAMLGTMALSTALGMLSPMFTKWLFGSVLESGSTQVLLALSVFMICFSLCQLLFGAFSTLLTTRIGIKQNIAVEAAVMGRLFSLPAPFFKQYSSGELTQRSQYVQNLCSTLFSTVGVSTLTSLFSLVYIGQIFLYAPAMVMPAVTITLTTIAISLITTFTQMRISKQRMQLSAKTSGMTYAMITGIQKIKLAGAEKRMFARWAKNYTAEASMAYNPPLFLRLGSTVSMTVSLLGSLVLYYTAVKSGVSVSDYYAFNAAYGMVSGAFLSLASLATTAANIKPTLDMAKPILEAEPEVSEGKEYLSSIRGEIELNHVSFRYDENMPNVIDDLSLHIRAGEYVAVVGSTGCGKSTLMRLILGFEKPQKGTIFYDKKDANRLDMRALRHKLVGAVMQDGKLFLGDIFSNITISAPELTMAEAWEAAEIASIADDIRAMPMGMHTIISEGQGGISGGQRQRLIIARAVAPKPKILLFDEATSALDNVTQKQVSEAIDKLKCTRVIIAHRLSTIRHADRIIYLHKGKIAESGTYEELIARNGLFAELVERQRIDVDAE